MPFNLRAIPTNKLGSLFFRMAAMAAKFAVFVFLSKYFGEVVYGVYTLIATTITVSIFVLGLDFYNFMIRDLLLKKKETASKIGSAFILYLIIYLLFFMLGYVAFKQIDYFSDHTPLILLICITEHFHQEIYRLLLAFKKVLSANWFLFFRVAGWTLSIVALILWSGWEITLKTVLMVWGGFNVGALFLVFLVFCREIRPSIFSMKIKKDWLLKGLKISMVFYTATLALKTIEYSNRYIVEGILGEASAGIFSFYSNFAMLVSLYVSTLVVSYEIPGLIESSLTSDFKQKLSSYKKLLFSHSLIASLVSLLVVYPVLLWQGKESFANFWPLAILLTFGMFLMNISLVYHAYLYIKHRERKILEITIIAGIINVVSTYFLCTYFGLYGAGIAFLITGISMFWLRKGSIKKKELEV
ncbi:MAG TPA: polysaccharide biosynthesis C-terminal domain-containing protein [Flavobacteriaceae bacterium]|nr:polysaccharide biosynthesis C-terminal domain-containing protein [Flavobacteriaceae bacterium]